MQIELNQEELETINAALECWEKDASSGALLGVMLGAMLTRPEDKEKEKLRNEEQMMKAERENSKRKLKSLMIRAKLAKAITELLAS